MTTINVTVANLSSGASTPQLVTIGSPAKVSEVLSRANVTLQNGQTAAFNGTTVNADTVISSDGLLSISGEAKAA